VKIKMGRNVATKRNKNVLIYNARAKLLPWSHESVEGGKNV
jgi:hypothetical protein